MSKSTINLKNLSSGYILTILLNCLIGCTYGSLSDGLADADKDARCSSCHGGEDNYAPPKSLSGGTETSELGVGAHQIHLNGGKIGGRVMCENCHVVPKRLEDEGHFDSLPAELSFSGISVEGGVMPKWNREKATCSSVYCHGATLEGGRHTSPIWTKVDGTQSKCDSCHGFPPPLPHPPVAECKACHTNTMNGDGGINAAGGHHIDGKVTLSSSCNTCHGGEENPAPPFSTRGESDTTGVSVGAHQAHLKDGAIRNAVLCSECHKVPHFEEDEGHISGKAEITWGALALSDKATPSWDRNSATCSSVYCHGATLSGGKKQAPLWTKVDGSQNRCDSCHGNPPPAPHPQNDDCHSCHAGTVTQGGEINTASGLHIDGRVDISAASCNACHGSGKNAAPPLSTRGESDTSLVEVGAHQAHLSDGSMRKAMACSDCHKVPSSVGDEGHLSGTAELTWGALAKKGGTTPEWNRTEATCSNYCHGETLGGGSNKKPKWTKVDGSQARCGTCHGMPPPAPHPADTNCALCHPGTMKPEGGIDVEGGLHINGKVETSGSSCNSCHGSGLNSAPPVSTRGETETTNLAVGAHQSHLKAGKMRGSMQCDDCHKVPRFVEEEGHISGAAELVWGALALSDGASPFWNRTEATCSNYCHGETLGGGNNKNPKWTKVDGTQARCGTCHGMPPPPPHPSSTNCSMCHPQTMDEDGLKVVGGKHIDGKVGFVASCNACHGSDKNAAPPVSTAGKTATTEIEVGAHQAHLNSGDLRGRMECSECHKVPTGTNDPGHISGTAELVWGALAKAKDSNPSWSRTDATCSSVYCHGATLEGGAANSPKWTKVDGTQKSCDSCHGNPPPAPHPNDANCNKCHPDTVNAEGKIEVEKGYHINSRVEVITSCNACHGSSFNAAPPVSTTGKNDTAELEVGAHQAHLKDGEIRKAMDCNQCHVKPRYASDEGHISGSAEIVFGPLAKEKDRTPAWNRGEATCSSVYCHGATLAGGTAKTPVWTTVDGSQNNCDSCHGNPPPMPHPQQSNCNKCHPETVDAQGKIKVSGGRHINATVDYYHSISCNDCHGSSQNAAPPTSVAGLTATTATEVGAHQTHLRETGVRTAVHCGECHQVPASMNSVGHIDASPAEVKWGSLATKGGSLSPAWNRAENKCSNVYCHGATISGGNAKTPVWTTVDGNQNKCDSCHGNPPDFPHPNDSNCNKCHPMTVNSSGGIILAGGYHINGVVDKAQMGCNFCHGNAQNAAPPLSVGGSGNTSTTEVGAHQAHLKDGEFRKAGNCSDCHTVPSAIDSSGHIDASPAEITWGTMAKKDGATPSWNRSQNKCSSVYCHGSTLSGGANTAPVWTTVNGTQATCGSCHGNPPPAPHPDAAGCFACHPDTVDEAGKIIVEKGKHINGTMEVVPMSCDHCHISMSGQLNLEKIRLIELKGSYHGESR